MINTRDILETIHMIEDENLDIRTITMGISLLDCCSQDIDDSCRRVYDKIARKAENLVKVGCEIEKEYGVPIINKRVAVTPIAMLAAASGGDPVKYALTLEKAAQAVGVNFIGGYSALVQKGFAPGDEALINSIPEALARTEHVCSSINIGSTKAGINMDAVALMGKIIRKTAELTADDNCIGAAKLVVFCNAPEDNPFMAGAFHGPGEPESVINVGVSGPGVVRCALKKIPNGNLTDVADTIKKTAFKITRLGQLIASEASRRLDVPFGIVDLSLAPTPAVGDSVAHILEEIGLEQCGAHGTTAALALLNDAVKKGGTMASSRHRGRRNDRRRTRGHTEDREARSDDGGLLRRSRYDSRSRRHNRRSSLGGYRGRGGYRHGEFQDDCGQAHPRHRQECRRGAELRRTARLGSDKAAQHRISRKDDLARRTHTRSAPEPQKLIKKDVFQ